jgi:ubiquinone/menaquinone biosynthesis C-methylase UbiE
VNTLHDVQRWLEHESVKYIRELGICNGQIIVDFGCNDGHYTIPAARVVGSEGSVYAIDKEQSTIDQLIKTAQHEGLNNIIPIVSSKPTINLAAGSVDAVLIYDVLHYLNRDERKNLFKSVNSVLKDVGILSVFPKHYQSDQPMWHLAELRIDDIIKEIENNQFTLIKKFAKRLIHDDRIETGIVINFKKSKQEDQR